jgi:hypothetical protein
MMDDLEDEIDYAKLDEFGQILARTRAEAIQAREQSGVEQIWYEDEEFYEGIDDLNRGDERSVMHQKPMFQSPKSSSGNETRSRVFPNITGPFVETGSARVADMLLPTDDRNWSIKPTPIPDLAKIASGEVPPEIQQQIDQQHNDPQQADEAEKALVLQAQQRIDQAAEAAEAAQQRIDDWHIESEWHAEVRKVIEDAARIGVGVLKGPFPHPVKTVLYENGGLVESVKMIPGTRRVDPWNFYPAADCGEDHHNGSGVWERDYLSRRQVRELMGQEGYIDAQIQQCLDEGPMQVVGTYTDKPTPETDPGMKHRYQIWYGHGSAEKEDLEAMGCDCSLIKEDISAPYMVTMINHRVVRLSLNPLDTGDYPYDVFVWRPRSGSWAGIGVARQIRTAQKIVTAAVRNLMDNAGLAAAPMLVMLRGVVPADGLPPGLGPRRVYVLDADADAITNAANAIGAIKIDMMVNEFMTIIRLGIQIAEITTSMPMMMQGQMGPSVPDTAAGQQLFQTNAGTVLRRLARLFDDNITEPRIRRDYKWLLIHGPDDREKGDFQIDARGSSALVERELQNQELMGLLRAFLDPRYGKDPIKGMDEYLKSRHFDPKRFEFEDEEWQQMLQNWQQMQQSQQGDPRIEVAQLRAQTEQQKLQSQQQENERDRQFDLMMKSVEFELEQAQQSGDMKKALDGIKARLADTVMRLRTQEKLAGMSAPAKLMNTPPTEPPQQAQPGQSYVQ